MKKKDLTQELICISKFDPLFDSIRNDNEFQAIVQRVENKKAEIRAKIAQLEENGLI